MSRSADLAKLPNAFSDSSNATVFTIDSSEQITVPSESGAVTTSVQQGLTKSWAQVDNAGEFTLKDSFNQSAATDTSEGQVTYNYTNSMANANYSCVSAHGTLADGGSGHHPMISTGGTATGSILLWVIDSDWEDANHNCMQVTGDLA